TIFMAEDCSADLNYTNTVIHGHNWLDDTVFSELTQYSDFDYYKKHPVIEYDTRTQMHKWKIYAVFITSASESEDNGYIFNYVYPHLGAENFDGYINEINKRTLFKTGVDINKNDKTLTLSTCTREVDKGKERADCRIVIVARMVRNGESASVDTSEAVKNSNPKYPQIWYTNKGIENPYKDDPLWYPLDLSDKY
ncbi:MAG: class B sortase, partial [Clostridiales bacterium]|nr:class B sortase [Clostridiales bacterium]